MQTAPTLLKPLRKHFSAAVFFIICCLANLRNRLRTLTKHMQYVLKLRTQIMMTQQK